MISYELAKELRDNGFPQPKGRDALYTKEGDPRYLLNDDKFNDPVWCPTLSELIEACGEKGFILVFRPYGKWNASANIQDEHTNIVHLEGEGDTPEEAVANLWLAINKK
jgi:hypothetical protein